MSNSIPSSEWPIPRLLWKHPHPEETAMYKFKTYIEKKRGIDLPTFHALYIYSTTHRASFWADAWSTFHLIHSGTPTRIVDESARIDSLPTWFAGTRLNFAENLLYTRDPHTGARSTAAKPDCAVAVVAIREGGAPRTATTWAALRARAALFAAALRAHGLRPGDRVATVSANSLDTLCVFLGSTALGGIFSSSSTDMGASGLLERLLQIAPAWVFVDDASVYNARAEDLRPKMAELERGLRAVAAFEGVVSMPRFERAACVAAVPRARTLAAFLAAAEGRPDPGFERIPFGAPFLIVYSSGTTGQPKCIVHSVGGVLMNGMKEGVLHREQGPGARVLQYTTTGWIMYLASVQSLLSGSRLVMYDGSPFVGERGLETYVRMIGAEGITHLGTSPRYLHELQKNNIRPRLITDLSALRNVTSTGMVLPNALFEWFYDAGFPAHVHLANISGGTDLAGAFGTENPLLPVYVGGCQGPSLGTPIAVYDQLVEGREGREVRDGVAGELVATQAFPNMPVCFWGDEGGRKYHGAYFERFDNVWTHGDFVVVHPVTKSLIFLGRADGVLNPSGIRFGSAEIYSVIEAHFADRIADSICVGQRRPQDADESVMLFLLMKPGERFDDRLGREVKEAIRVGLSRRHVPKWVFETPEIPTTVNLKKVELPVKQIVSGMTIKPSGTLLNPKSLDYYYRFAKVEELAEPASKL